MLLPICDMIVYNGTGWFYFFPFATWLSIMALADFTSSSYFIVLNYSVGEPVALLLPICARLSIMALASSHFVTRLPTMSNPIFCSANRSCETFVWWHPYYDRKTRNFQERSVDHTHVSTVIDYIMINVVYSINHGHLPINNCGRMMFPDSIFKACPSSVDCF